MATKVCELPFLPIYETEYVSDNQVKVVWFEPNFSQSRYNVYNKPMASNACTLIVVLVASKCNKFQLIAKEEPLKTVSTLLVQVLAESVLQGNRIHEDLQRRNLLKYQNLNVPEALKAVDLKDQDVTEWKSVISTEPLSKSLCANLKSNLTEWLRLKNKVPSDLYVLLVAGGMTVLFLIHTESRTVALFDSHQHLPKRGAFLAATKLSRLGALCWWYHDVLKKCYNSDPTLYELSFIYFRKK